MTDRTDVKQLAVIISVVGFFGLAIVGWISGLAPHTCGIRAAGGAVVLFVLMRFAGRLTTRILADAIVENRSNTQSGRRMPPAK